MAYFVVAFLSLILSVSTQRFDFETFWRNDAFHFENCNRSAVPLNVSRVFPTQLPIKLNKETLIFLDFYLDRAIGVNLDNIEVDLNMRLKTDRGYTELCEIIGEEVCHYNDLCAVLRDFTKAGKCPPLVLEKYHNNCSCPFLKNYYSIPIIIPPPTISFEIRGTFDLTIKLQEEGNHIACLDLQFCISNCEPLPQEYIVRKFKQYFNLGQGNSSNFSSLDNES